MRVVTWNIAGGRKTRSLKHFDYSNEDLEYFASQLKNLRPAVVCLQEAHTSQSESSAGRIAGLLNLPHVYNSPASPSHIEKSSLLGNAIISSLPFQKRADFFFPPPRFELKWKNGKPAERHNKLVQLVKIGQWNIANTQLLPIDLFGYYYDLSAGRKYAAEIENILLNLTEPCVLCGDFSGAFKKQPVEKVFNALFTKLDLKDSLPNEITRPTKQGWYKTDHIYFSPQLSVTKSGIVKTATDHYLCYTDIAE